MYIKDLNIGEGAYLEDKLDLDFHGKMERKCMIVMQTVNDHTFSLTEALETYNVPLETYIDFKVRNVISEVRSGLGETSEKQPMITLAAETSSAVHKYFKLSKFGYNKRKALAKKTANQFEHGNLVDHKFKEFFIDELRDMFWTEINVAKTLPKITDFKPSDALYGFLERPVIYKDIQVDNLSRVFELFNRKPVGRVCTTVAHFLTEAKDLIHDNGPGTLVRGAGVLMATQKILHYKIASYTSLKTMAESMGNLEAAEILSQALENEKATNIALTDAGQYWINKDDSVVGSPRAQA